MGMAVVQIVDAKPLIIGFGSDIKIRVCREPFQWRQATPARSLRSVGADQLVVRRMAVLDRLGSERADQHARECRQNACQLCRKLPAGWGCQKEDPGQKAQHDRKIAPWVVALLQYRPNTSGTNAPTSVT